MRVTVLVGVPGAEIGERRVRVLAAKALLDFFLKLNPKSDYAHHMLGRWHQEIADIGATINTMLAN